MRLNSLAAGLALGLLHVAASEGLPPKDLRADTIRDTNTRRSFPSIDSRQDWVKRAAQIRERILVSCGLWPMPDKLPLQPSIHGRKVRDGYSVENVYFQTLPGFYLAGNLYRPVGQGDGPFPGVLNPHGHWSNGRLADEPAGSIAARCIQLARLGMVAFSYDMVGYNDTAQVTHSFANAPTNQLWSVSLMGLQTWNSIRALDFLCLLPDVDAKRLACTGESGGGTQTFMLGAIDDRISVQAPVVMVSCSMQGGCLCENAPGLRVRFSNPEFAAAPAPRPQILVAASGDWTRETPSVEGPAIAGVYRLFDAGDRLRYVRFDAEHNYNQTSREAVYTWFNQWLLRADPPAVREAPYAKEPDETLRVWASQRPPVDALPESRLIQQLIATGERQLQALSPADPASLRRARDVLQPLWRETLQLDADPEDLIFQVGESSHRGGLQAKRFWVGRRGQGDRLPSWVLTREKRAVKGVVVLLHPDGVNGCLGPDRSPIGVAQGCLDRQWAVVLVDTFLTGELAHAAAEARRNPYEGYFTTYNRTELQERVQDTATVLAFARHLFPGLKVTLCGQQGAGLWAALAAPLADATVLDADRADVDAPAFWMERSRFVPGIKRLGGPAIALGLAAPHPVVVHNLGGLWDLSWAQAAYRSSGRQSALTSEAKAWEAARIADWICRAGPTPRGSRTGR